MPIINKSTLDRTLARQGAPKIAKRFEAKVRDIVRRAQEMMLVEFAAHPVTMEIEAGASASNMSNTLVGARAGANLFNFIGFQRGDNPIQALRMYLATKLGVRKVRSGRKGIVIDFLIDLPDLETIYNLTPIPWAPGMSWADGVEKGIPGLAQFLVGSGKGRSGGGLQAQVVVNGASFARVKYMSDILQDLVKNIVSQEI